MEQIILNLAVNSREAMPSGGRLTIETMNIVLGETDAQVLNVSPGPYAVLEITDTGCGMDAETSARVFEPFFTTKAQGTGLGLATVYGIVKQSGGAIFVSSELGKGTTFKIYLPEVSESPEASAAVVENEEPIRGSETILLVEDKDDVRSLVHDVLAGNGYDVLSANGPEEAMRVAGGYTGPIHLVLTDVVMPGSSGRDLVEKLAALLPDTKVLYMSGFAEQSVVQRSIDEEASAFLQKPFTPRALMTKVRELLNRR
jgi:CheY-like chemotaxis protein